VRAEFDNVGVERSLHDFEILFVLGGGAGGDLVKPFAEVRLTNGVEAAEGGEELIVAADAGARDEAAHGEGVNEGVVEFLILEGAVGTDVTFATDWLRREASSGGCGFEEAVILGIDAETVCGSILDKGLGVYGAGEMHVKVSAFGHAGEECVQFERTKPGGFEGADGVLFLRGCRGSGVRRWVSGRLRDCDSGEIERARCEAVASNAWRHEASLKYMR